MGNKGRPLGRPRPCSTQKISYRTASHALLMAVYHSQKYDDCLFPYHCPKCDQYHLTRQPQTPEDAILYLKHRRQLQRALDSRK